MTVFHQLKWILDNFLFVSTRKMIVFHLNLLKPYKKCLAISTLGNDENSGESMRHFKSLMNVDFSCVEKKLRIDLNCTASTINEQSRFSEYNFNRF